MARWTGVWAVQAEPCAAIPDGGVSVWSCHSKLWCDGPVENGPVTDTPHPSARYDDRAQRYADAFHADAFQDETVPKFPVDRNMIRMLVDIVGERPRVLDAGCGAGQVTKMLQNWGVRCGRRRRGGETHRRLIVTLMETLATG